MNEELKDAINNDDNDFLIKNIDESNINHRFRDEDNDTLLSYAISNPKSNAYQFLINKNADLKLVNDEGENILHSAVYSKDLERIKKVLDFENINGQSNDGTTPLILSIALDCKDISNYLIDKSASIDLADYDGNAPIHLASFFGQIDIVKKLIKNNAILDCKTKKGNLPLALAVNNNHLEIIKILYKKMYC
jgi:ankyrin repeat protein